MRSEEVGVKIGGSLVPCIPGGFFRGKLLTPNSSLPTSLPVAQSRSCFSIVAFPRPMSNAFPKISVLPDRAGGSPPAAGQTAQRTGKPRAPEGPSPSKCSRFPGLPAKKSGKNSGEPVDISKKFSIIGASMIEARTSRVRLPKGQDRGGGKGLPPRLWPSRLREPEPGRGRRSYGLSPPRRWSAVVDSSDSCVRVEVMTSCHDFIFF